MTDKPRTEVSPGQHRIRRGNGAVTLFKVLKIHGDAIDRIVECRLADGWLIQYTLEDVYRSTEVIEEIGGES